MNEKERAYYWYWFVNIPGIGDKTQRHLIEEMGHPSDVYHAKEQELKKLLTDRQIESWKRSRNIHNISESQKRLEAQDVQFIHWESEEYPSRLRQLYDPPLGLYLKGRLPDPSKCSLAMVGSRKTTRYGREMASYFAEELSRKEIQIISGLAAGIDAASHQGALRGKGYTLGILGGGIDTMYPRENFNLYMEMYEKGGVLSESNVGVPNHPGLFPRRNRLISGLSDGVFVLEAAEKSGTFITADQALEQGKNVLALPGRITDPNSYGTNLLISQGAVPVQGIEDILEALGYREGQENENEEHVVASVQSDFMMKTLLTGLSEDETTIYGMMDETEPVDFSMLLRISGFSIDRLRHILYELEMQKLIFQPNQNVYLKRFVK